MATTLQALGSWVVPRQPQHSLLQQQQNATPLSCLRKRSAYPSPMRLPYDDESDEEYLAKMERRQARRERRQRRQAAESAKQIKKQLSFADQHGQNLVLARVYSPFDAPVHCSNLLAAPTATPSKHNKHVFLSPLDSMQLLQQMRYSTLWGHEELLSMCLLSCSIISVMVAGYHHTVK